AGMVAFYHQIPFCHVEAGLRTDSVSSPFPEEINRRICTLTASIHCCPTENARHNLTAAEGSVAVTGNTVVDALKMVPTEPPAGRLVLVTCHRRENQRGGLARIRAAVEQLADRFAGIEFLWISHPNYTQQLTGLPENVSVLEPVGYAESIQLINRAELVMTDSGGITEEAVSLSTPVHILRETTERAEAVEAGSALLVGTATDHIVKHATDALTSRTELPSTPLLFGDGRAAERILTQCVDYLKTA
ncbi:MAG: UDP-N-acetyl glucosamine 2-epimerase, partial [Planctomycetaceae bacterium]|nr:UDP-N-acetyl glucosamine 2-epimerase [Planctomycetaceae bacterium]